MALREDRDPVLILLALVAFGLLLRLPGIGYSFYGDEQFSLLRDSRELIPTSDDRFRPVFFTLLYLWRQVGFHGEVGLRILPLVFGLLQIPVAYGIGRRLGGPRLAVGFSLLVAVSPMLIEFSQELRMYSLVGLVALLQVWALLRLLERDSLWRWVAFAGIGLLGIYTHLHYWLFLAGIAVSLFRERRSLRLWKSITAMAALVLLYLPNLANLRAFATLREGAYSAFDLPSALPKLIAAVTVGFNYFALGQQTIGRPVEIGDLWRNGALAILAGIPAVVLFTSLVRVLGRKRPDRSLALSYELVIVPTLLAFAATVALQQYWVQPKYIIFVTPYALLLIAVLYRDLPHAWLKGLVLACAAGVEVIALAHFWNPAMYGRREDWRGAAAMLRSASGPTTALVLLVDYPLIKYYWPESESHWRIVSAPSIENLDSTFVRVLRAKLSGKRTVYYLRWDVVEHRLDPRGILFTALDKIGTQRREIRYNPRLVCYEWQILSARTHRRVPNEGDGVAPPS
jgi:4-amino-4-deoxy-L-arabinose transferase-like glycosyltransferase